MKGFYVMTAALVMILVSLLISTARNMSDAVATSSDGVSETGERLVALTFDDGPDREKTTALLDMLKEKGVSATFFMIGAYVEENAEIVKRMDAEGHQIGVHTYSHVDLGCLTEAEQREEIEKTRQAIWSVVGERELAVRPPFGRINKALEDWIDSPMILWDVDTLDWTGKAAEEIIMETVESVRDGDIILMHDISENGLEGAEGIIDELQRMGYTFLTIDQLFYCKGIELENGVTYRYAR